jgi:putative ABC transport system permease protein
VTAAWRAALRLARRDALRHRWRSLLIVVLILAPVAAATGVDILYRTQTSTALERERYFGGADMVVTPDSVIAEDGTTNSRLTERQIVNALPTGSRVVFDQDGSSDVFTTPGHVAEASVKLTDHVGDPLLRSEVDLVSGRAPGAGGEVAISRKLADRLGIDGVGSTLALRNGPAATVTGIVRNPFCLSCAYLVASPTSTIGRALSVGAVSGRYLVDLPTADENAGAGRFGQLQSLDVYVQMRAAYSGYEIGLGDLKRANRDDIKAAALVTLVAGLGLLEVVLLAGTAFAVGARRQTRDLGMIAAQGGSPRDLRRVVLAQGLILGVLGALAGVAAGFGGIIAARPLLERINNEVMVGVHFGAVEIAVVAVVGLVSGLAAALIPAVGAGRRRPVDALAARFPVPTQRSRIAPALGSLLIAGGATISLAASYLMTHGGNGGGFAYTPIPGGERQPFVSGRLGDTDGAIAILLGVFVVVAGLLLIAPAFLALLARLAGRLPATLRLATRDAARHRHRTGPAAAAIAVAVGGAVAISCLIASDREGQGTHQADAVPDRTIALSHQNAIDESMFGPATEALEDAIPGAQLLRVRVPVLRPVSAEDDYYPSGLVVTTNGRLGGDWVGVGDPDLVVLASGRTADRAAAESALQAGKAIVFDAELVDGQGRVAIGAPGDDRAPVLVPAVVLDRDTPYRELPQAFVPASVVSAQHWETQLRSAVVSYPPSSRDQASAAITAAEQLGVPVITGGDERDHVRLIRVGLSAGAALIGLLGVAMCVALSGAEGRPDLATLAAIGAPPGRRRRLAAAQALVLAVIGTALGVAFGFFFARAARPSTGAVTTVIPWSDLLVTVAAVPLLAVGVAALGSVGRVPLTRRAD